MIAKGGKLWADSCAVGCALGSGVFTPIAITGAVAALAKESLLNSRGRLKKDSDPRVREFVSEGVASPMAVVELGGKTLFQSDIASFMQAKASVATMIDYMLERAGITADRIKDFTLTGALGCALDTDAAKTTGLLPELENASYIRLEDAVLKDASMLLCYPNLRSEVEEICRRICYV